MIKLQFMNYPEVDQKSLMIELEGLTVPDSLDITLMLGRGRGTTSKPNEGNYPNLLRFQVGSAGFYFMYGDPTWQVRETCDLGHIMHVTIGPNAVPLIKSRITCSTCNTYRSPVMPFHEFLPDSYSSNTYSGIASESKRGWDELPAFVEKCLYRDINPLTATIQTHDTVQLVKDLLDLWTPPVALPQGTLKA